MFARHFSIYCRNSRKCKPEEEEDDEYSDEDSYASSDEEDRQSDAPSDNEDDEEDSEVEDKRVKPFIHRNWQAKDDESAYQSVDGNNKLFNTGWNGRRYLTWRAESALKKGQKSLVAKQEKSSIVLDAQFGRRRKKWSLTQVPYRKFPYCLIPFFF